MAIQQGGLESFGADNLNGPALNSRANTASRPGTMNPALSRSKAASRARSQMPLGDAVDPQVEYIPALKLE